MVARTTSTSSTSLGSCPASDFVELLGATRAETSQGSRGVTELGAADELQNAGVCAKDRVAGVFKADIVERTVASVPRKLEQDAA